MDGARPVHSFPFSGNTAFMLGNEVGAARGLSCMYDRAMCSMRLRLAVCTGLLLRLLPRRSLARPAAWQPRSNVHAVAGSSTPLDTAHLPDSVQGAGLNEKQLALCDSFIYIPQVRWLPGSSL